jgi:hypothetical protein
VAPRPATSAKIILVVFSKNVGILPVQLTSLYLRIQGYFFIYLVL